MTKVQRKQNTNFLIGNYAKQERASMLSGISSLYITGEKQRPTLFTKKVVNSLLHIFSAREKPTHKDMLYLQAILSVAGNRLAKYGDEVIVNKAFVDEESREAFNNFAEDNPEIRNSFGYGSQIEFYTSYYEILMKAGLGDSLNSRKALKRSLLRLGRITHEIHIPELYENEEFEKGHNELFLKYDYNNESGKLKLTINSMFTNALTAQFTLIDLSVKKNFIRNERALALYDFIIARVNRGEDQHFNLDRVIKVLEENTDDIDKHTRKKYKKLLEKLNDYVDWNIQTYGTGEKLVFNVDWKINK